MTWDETPTDWPQREIDELGSNHIEDGITDGTG